MSSAAENRYSYGQPNLTPYRPPGWPDKIVVSKRAGTNADDIPLTDDDTLYVDYSVLNSGTASGSFYVDLYVDGTFRVRFGWFDLYANYYLWDEDYSLGSLTAGIHTVQVQIVATSETHESNRDDNTYTKMISVMPGSSPSVGSLRVTISPQEAIAAGAKWRRVGTPTWRNSDDTESGIAAGAHTVEFKAVAGWNTPDNVPVTIARNQTQTVSGWAYTQGGSLLLTSGPEEAISAGAAWRVDGGDWRMCSYVGYDYADLALGSHTVDFKAVQGWSTPGSRSFIIVNGQTTHVSGMYSRVLAPASGAVWEKKTKCSILWNSEAFRSSGKKTRVRIELWRDGLLVRRIVGATPNDGNHPWRVPNARTLPMGKGFSIRVFALNGSGDSQSNEFSIGPSDKAQDGPVRESDGVFSQEIEIP